MPEELLGAYRVHFERFAAFRAGCEEVLRRTLALASDMEAQLGGIESKAPGAYRKAFAALAVRSPARALLSRRWMADWTWRIRQQCRDDDEVRELLRALETGS